MKCDLSPKKHLGVKYKYKKICLYDVYDYMVSWIKLLRDKMKKIDRLIDFLFRPSS